MKIEVIAIENLLKTVQELEQTINDNNRNIDKKDTEIKYLKEKIDYLIRQQYSSKSEKFKPNHPSLFDDLDEDIPVVEDEEIEITFKRKKGGRTSPPKDLQRVVVEHDFNDEEKICECGCQMHIIKKVISEQYDVIPAKFQIIENVRYRYGCNCGAKPKTSPLTPQILPRTQVSPSFLATIAIHKFEDGLPLYRQAKIYKKRFGVPFTDTTLSNWIIQGSNALQPVMELMQKRLVQNDYIQADETTLQVLNEKNKKPTSKSYIWLGIGMDRYKVVYMKYADNRRSSVASSMFKGFNNGYLQTDGYAGYNQVVLDENITHLGCWAHARRKFADIIKSGKSDEESKRYASEAIILIRKLYKIEKEIKDDPPDIKLKIREEKTKPIIETIREWIDTKFFKAQKIGGAIARAFVYLNNQFNKLIEYLKDGNLHIDNNLAENHVRPIAIGRKNWLFATSVKGANAVADWYSIIETAKLNGLEPFKYLKYLLRELPIYISDERNIEELMPWCVDESVLG